MKNLKIIVTEDGSQSLYREDLLETYHSFHGAIQESSHVFIDMGLKHYLQTFKPKQIKVLEVGFGTALNALLALQFAEENEIDIYFETLETLPLTKSIYQKLAYTKDPDLAHKFQLMHDCKWGKVQQISERFTLHKVRKPLQKYWVCHKFDLVFFDAFAPSKQPELWEELMMKKVHGLLHDKGMMTTYCAKGQLKRDLKSVGFKVITLPGAPGKKEMVRGEK